MRSAQLSIGWRNVHNGIWNLVPCPVGYHVDVFYTSVFIMFQTLWYVMNMSWTGVKRYLNIFLMLVSILLTVGIACSALHRNETSVVVLVISFFVALSIFDGSCLRVLNDWLNWDGQQELPRNWNDVSKSGQVCFQTKTTLNSSVILNKQHLSLCQYQRTSIYPALPPYE